MDLFILTIIEEAQQSGCGYKCKSAEPIGDLLEAIQFHVKTEGVSFRSSAAESHRLVS